MLDTKNYKVVEFSWIEKRQDLLDGIATLPEALREEAQLAIAGIDRDVAGDAPKAVAPMPGKPIETAHFVLGIDAKTGAITRLRNKATGREWASERNPIALLTYQTLSQDDYSRYRASYLTTKADWAQKDFGKPNIERFGAQREEWHAAIGGSACGRDRRCASHRHQLGFNDDEAFSSGRAAFPRHAFVELAAAQKPSR